MMISLCCYILDGKCLPYQLEYTIIMELWLVKEKENAWTKGSRILLPSARHLEEGRGTTILELLRHENCISKLCPRPLGSHPSPNTQIVKRYPEPMAHGPEAYEPSHPLWPMARGL